MRVYIAADFGRAPDANRVAERLDRNDHIRVVSRWHRRPDVAEAVAAERIGGPSDDTIALKAAERNLEDIDACDVFVVLTTGAPARGGRHFETGYAFARRKTIVVAGPREHAFQQLAHNVVSDESLLEDLLASQYAFAPDGDPSPNLPRSSHVRSHLIEILQQLTPVDDLEEQHRLDALAWIISGAQLYRYKKPDRPTKHLVAYVVLIDIDASAVLLVDHRSAQRWLPTGGHVEHDEDPADTARRELREELGIAAPLVSGLSSNPLLITQTTTAGRNAGHVDVSLWYVVSTAKSTPLTADPNEFASVRWWTFDEVGAAPIDRLDPHLPRFLAKLRRDLGRPQQLQ